MQYPKDWITEKAAKRRVPVDHAPLTFDFGAESLCVSPGSTLPDRYVRLRLVGAQWDMSRPMVCIEIGSNTGIKDIEKIFARVEEVRDALTAEYGPEPDLSREMKNIITEGLIERRGRGETYTQLAQWVNGCIEDCLRVSLMIPDGATAGVILGDPGLSNWGNGWFGYMTAMELARWFGGRLTEEDRQAYLQRARANIQGGHPAWGPDGKESPVDDRSIRERLRQKKDTVG